jgi:hypothetical protein
MRLNKFLKISIIFLIIFAWIFSGWPRIWPLGGFDKLTTGELGVNNTRIPPEIQEAQAADTGFKTTTSTAVVTSSAGDNNGFETTYGTNTPKDTTTDNAAGLASANTSSGAVTDGCTTFPQTEDDQHDFYTFGFSVPANSTINGIEIGTQLLVSSNSGTNLFCFALSYNGGTNWTTAISSGDIGTAEAAVTLGGAANTWGRTWSVSELSDANFRIRVMLDPSATLTYTFSMDLLQVKVYYTPPAPSITAPSSVAMPNYTLGGVGYSEKDFSGSVHVDASASFTVTVVSSNLTGGGNTILASNVKLRTDDVPGNPPTTITCTGFTPDEPVADEYALDTAKNVVTATLGVGGTCDIYPTIKVYISNNLLAAQVTGTLTFTVQ